ncbi:MAG: helix-turn-helix transcriptional regulator [Panacagrimonas sp.]
MSQQLNDAPRVKLDRLPETCRRAGLSKPTLYRLEALGRFPKRMKIGERISAWRSDEVSAWIEARTADARGTK